MARKRKAHAAAFKAQVALAAVKGDKTINELAKQYGVHPTLIHGWKKQLLAGVDEVFARGNGAAAAEDHQAVQAQLYEHIGRLKMDLEWLKKNSATPASDRRALVDPEETRTGPSPASANCSTCRGPRTKTSPARIRQGTWR
jgi:putative transposase